MPADAAVAVADGVDTTWILVGAGVSAVVVVAGLTIVVRKRHAHLQAILLMLFTEVPTIQPRNLARAPRSPPPVEYAARICERPCGH